MMEDGQTGFASGYNGRILKTTDGWQSADSMPTGNGSLVFRLMHMVNEDTGYAVGGDNFSILDRLYRTTDGEHWTMVQNLKGSWSVAAIHFVNGKTGFMAGNNGKDVIAMTEDAGETWTEVHTYNSSGWVYTGLDIVGPFGYATMSTGRIVKSLDGGKTWTALESFGANDYLSAIDMYNERLGIIAGQKGVILNRFSSAGAEKADIGELEFSLYPNPSAGVANVQVMSDARKGYTINVTDLQGRSLYSATGTLNKGSNTLNLPLQHLSQGTYMVEVSTAAGHSVQMLRLNP